VNSVATAATAQAAVMGFIMHMFVALRSSRCINVLGLVQRPFST
jgi:hypothetical protein